jgi:hypothetical protein
LIELKRLRNVVFCLCCAAAPPALATQEGGLPAPMVARTQEQFQAALSSGKNTPLDALTPYGKRRFARGLKWGENGLGGFGTAPLVRELSADQVAAVLGFLDSANYLPMLTRDLAGAPLRMPEPGPDVEQRLERLTQFAEAQVSERRAAPVSATTSGAQALLRRYQDLFGDRMNKAMLAQVPLGDLPVLFDAAALVSFESPGGPASSDMRMVHHAMAARGMDTRRTFDEAILSDLIAAREFEQARAFAALKPDLPSPVIPKVVDPLGPGFNGRSVYHYDAANDTLTRQAAPTPAGTELVMVVAAGCHFSQDALEALRKDADLQAKLRAANLVLLIDLSGAIPFHFIAEWNAANPALPMRVPHSAREWPAIADVASVPAFYLLKQGAVLGRLEGGWPAGGNKAALIKLLGTATM